ncbi:MAG: hydroxymethylbilane synthase [Geminicoccaceae bacterium]
MTRSPSAARPRLRIGTRGSPLARAQAELVRRALEAAHPDLAEPGALEVVIMRTTGDRVVDRPLAEIGGKGLFCKEIEAALHERSIDLAVHSMKDLPTVLPDGLTVGAMLEREDPRDVLIARAGPARAGLQGLPEHAVVGSASLRRKAQLLAHRPDLEIVPMRGNVDTRLRKLAAGEVDATVLALAGLKRLAADLAGAVVLEPEEMLPAVGQGAIGIECRTEARILDLLAALDHVSTTACVRAERALLDALDGSCRTPIAGYAEVRGATLRLRALVARPDGSAIFRAARTGPMESGEALGRDAGVELRRRAGPGFFD